jgi:hypothetical protein
MGGPYLLNYHGVAQEIWLASPLFLGRITFGMQDGRMDFHPRERMISSFLLETELAVPLFMSQFNTKSSSKISPQKLLLKKALHKLKGSS